MEEDYWQKLFVFGFIGFLAGPAIARGLWYAKFALQGAPGGEGAVAQAMIYQYSLPGVALLGLFGGPLLGIVFGFTCSFLCKWIWMLWSRLDRRNRDTKN